MREFANIILIRCMMVAFCATILTSCREEIKAEDVAMHAAKAYYDQLLHGDYASFVAGTEGFDSIHPTYREQLETNLKQYIGKQKAAHGGIDSVAMLRAKVDTIGMKDGNPLRKAEAYLLLCFRDSTREAVVVPMVERQGVWYMK